MTIGAIIGTVIIVIVGAIMLHPRTQRKLEEWDSKLVATDGETVKVVDKIQYRWTGQPKGGHN